MAANKKIRNKERRSSGRVKKTAYEEFLILTFRQTQNAQKPRTRGDKCNTHGTAWKVSTILMGKPEENHLGHVSVDLRIILKWI
jgi:hypothetical protein